MLATEVQSRGLLPKPRTSMRTRDKAGEPRKSPARPCSLELHKTMRKLNGKLDAEVLESLDAMTRAIVNKLLHDPTMFLKERKGPEELQVAREIFRLSEEGPKNPD